MHGIGEFADSYFLWRDPMIVGIAAGAVCGFLGVYVALRRIIFVSAALTQVSSLGVALAFYLQGLASHGSFVSVINPFGVSLAMTAIASGFFALKKNYTRISQEGVIGFFYVLASGMVIILSERAAKGAHDISDILFGSAVVVSQADVWGVPTAALLILAIHLVFFKDFLFVSFDPEMASLFGYPVRALNLALMLTIGVAVAVSTRAIGALPVFGLMALPALAALYLTENIIWAFILSALIGTASAGLGYFFSFLLSIPTGAAMAAMAAAFFLIAWLWRAIKPRLIPRAQ
ncbi:MAG: metal ABC transporter permease [Deltaproteobacteria bacterium]